jgi:hypothetical protein
MSLLIAASLLTADWRYIAPKAGADMEHSPLRALEMSAEKPEGLTESANYRGKRRSYSQLRFGSPSSVRVAVVLDESDGETNLYVDRNRDRTIDEQDRRPEKGPVWRFHLDALEVEGDAATVHQREVVVRKGRQRGRLSMATVGYLEGAVEIDGKQVRCRRTDEDANGRFGDPADRLHFDFDGDRAFDPIAERFTVAPIVAMRGRRYAFSGDPWRGRLSFIAIEGEGKIALKPPTLKRKAEVASIRAGLAGRDGTPAALAQQESLAAPPGDYRMDTLNLLLTEAGQFGWQYTFAYRGGKPPVWRSVRRDDSLAVDPVGELSFSIEPNETYAGVRAGDEMTVQLRLFTGDGLLINEILRTSDSGPAGAQPTAVVSLTTTDGRLLGEAHSGFA